jgi:cellobiose-specific phosphotransferase system component IIA
MNRKGRSSSAMNFAKFHYFTMKRLQVQNGTSKIEISFELIHSDQLRKTSSLHDLPLQKIVNVGPQRTPQGNKPQIRFVRR